MAAGTDELRRDAGRLSRTSVGQLGGHVARPSYRPDQVGVRHLHLGVGAFMRAHIAVYSDTAIGAAGGDWGISGVSLRHPQVRDQLAPQDCLYTVASRDGQGVDYRLIGALREMHVAPEEPAGIVGLIADPRIRVITLTVTEKGYCLRPDSGQLDTGHPKIIADLEGISAPTTTIGLLVAGLVERQRQGVGAVTILSCDNLPANGEKLQRAVLAFAELAAPEIGAWLEQNVRFPMTMVDRIVPATVPFDIDQAAADLGVRDEALVKAEPFSQWVIEDDFAASRPAWEEGGAQFVPDVSPYEKAKHRLLNGPHSALAYVGFLAGFEYAHEAIGEAAIAAYLERLMQSEIAPVSPEPDGMEHPVYIDAVLERFANPALMHRTQQIASDGSQKLPQRLLGTVRDQLRRDGPVSGLALAVAAWMRYCTGIDEQGKPYDVADPLSKRFKTIAAHSSGDAGRLVNGFLSIAEVFGSDLPAEPRFREAVESKLSLVLESGVMRAIELL